VDLAASIFRVKDTERIPVSTKILKCFVNIHLFFICSSNFRCRFSRTKWPPLEMPFLFQYLATPVPQSDFTFTVSDLQPSEQNESVRRYKDHVSVARAADLCCFFQFTSPSPSPSPSPITTDCHSVGQSAVVSNPLWYT
jgi:hypothetical protein